MRLNTFSHFPQTPSIAFGGKLTQRAEQLAEIARTAENTRIRNEKIRLLTEAKPVLEKIYVMYTDVFDRAQPLTGYDVLHDLRDFLESEHDTKNGFSLHPDNNGKLVSLETLLNKLTRTDEERTALEEALIDLTSLGLVQKLNNSRVFPDEVTSDSHMFFGPTEMGEIALKGISALC